MIANRFNFVYIVVYFYFTHRHQQSTILYEDHERCLQKSRNMGVPKAPETVASKSTESSTLIRNATELLESSKISVNEFLDSIAKMKMKQYSKEANANKRVSISSDDDTDVDEQPSTSQAATTHKPKRARVNTEGNDDVQPSTSQATTTQKSKRARINYDNVCRMCECSESNVILLPCAHAVLCFECWSKKLIQNDKRCVLCSKKVSIAKKF